MAATDPNAPADTRMMGVVHDALRRDLRRTRDVLASGRRPPAGQRRAVADHLRWMVQFLHGFARRYRRRSAARWGRPSPPRHGVQTVGHAEVLSDAAPAAVWEVLRDVTRVGEWSHECRTAAWLDGATEAAPGARFRGRNRAGMFRWGRVCEIVTADPWELSWRTIPSLLYPDTTTWTIRLHEHGRGTRIVQTFEGRCPRALALAYGTVIPAHRDRTRALTDDLGRLGAAGAAAAGGLAHADTAR